MTKSDYYNEQIYADIHAVALQLGMISQIKVEDFERAGDKEAAARWNEHDQRCMRVIYWALSHHKDAEKAAYYKTEYENMAQEGEG